MARPISLDIAIYSERKLICSRCKIAKVHVFENFRKCSEVRNGKPYDFIKKICRSCEHADRVEYGRKNRERQNSSKRASSSYLSYRISNLKKKYGIDQEEYLALLAKQGGRCMICKKSENEWHRSGRNIPLCVDHSHNTGKIRGLLCGSCNRGLGDFRDSIEFMEAAIAYLKVTNG